jgi:hypothetical protein
MPLPYGRGSVLARVCITLATGYGAIRHFFRSTLNAND